MKTISLTCVLSMVLTTLHAQQSTFVTIGRIDSVRSRILESQRKIWVHLPPSAHNPQGKRKYPVVYLLDAEKYFTSVVGLIDELSSINGNTFWPEMIVVGIPNTDRVRDLTPTRVTSGLWINSNFAEKSGGGENFMAFIEKELIPYVDSSYPTTTYRMLIGHSLGGLTVVNALVHHKDLFGSYVAIDPSMWWDRQRLLYEAEQALKKTSYSGKAVFLAIANTQPPGMDTVSLQRDTTSGTLHPRSIILLGKFMKRNKQDGLQGTCKYYDDENHGSIALAATYDALHFIFKDYSLKFQESYFTDPTFNMTTFLKDHYEKIGSKYGLISEDGRALLPPQSLVDGIGYRALREKQFNKAEELFKMNAKNYPESCWVYNALGDLYVAIGDKANAINSYKKSLSLEETPETRKKLENIGK